MAKRYFLLVFIFIPVLKSFPVPFITILHIIVTAIRIIISLVVLNSIFTSLILVFLTCRLPFVIIFPGICFIRLSSFLLLCLVLLLFLFGIFFLLCDSFKCNGSYH